MNISSLVAKAREESPKFKQKYDWWVGTRQKQPELGWLMPLLEDALGTDAVKEAAMRHIADTEAQDAQEREQEKP